MGNSPHLMAGSNTRFARDGNLKEASVAVARPDDPLRQWPLGMALEIGIYLLMMVVTALVALAAALIF